VFLNFIFPYLQIIWQPEKNAETILFRAQFKQSKFHDSSSENEFEFIGWKGVNSKIIERFMIVETEKQKGNVFQ
jgi:hypothetical protein